MATEEFRWGNVRVTSDVAQFGNTTYPIRNIGSLTVRVRDAGVGGCFPSIAIGVVTLGLCTAASVNELGFLVQFLIILVGMAGVAWAISKSTGEQEAVLILKTSSGDVEAFKSQDVGLVHKIASAIEEGLSVRK